MLSYEAGIVLLENSLDKVKGTKLSIHKHKYHKVKQAIILGAVGKSDFGKPAVFLELEEFRIIDILKSNGIEKIVIVNGYKKEYYEELYDLYLHLSYHKRILQILNPILKRLNKQIKILLN
ncbi:hypothetical protein [Clostridium perfringens]|uniref:hypothetical protein n=1 Tax=Clostridium perfringens TaxID=1502 RepID=UPI0023F746D8|nr:hypothetical protein [Clostridium perfringens]WEV22661.1 hypothetical protein PL327_03025 [Clostridium perfringens D]